MSKKIFFFVLLNQKTVIFTLTKVDNAEDFDIVMPLHDLLEYNENYLEKNQEVYGNITEKIQA